MPPGRASRSALRPFHCTIFSGSMKKSNTVSGRAAILISRSTAAATSGCSTATTPPSLFEFRRHLEPLEPLVPEGLDERAEVGKAFRPHPIKPPRPFASLGEKSGSLEHGEVLRDRRPGDVEAGGNLARAQLPLGDELEDAAPMRLGDGTDGGLHGAPILSRCLRKVQLTKIPET